MDIITQALLGATLTQSVARKSELKYAAVVGSVAGILADADILIQSSTDSLLTIEYHRHFSHALVFIPIGALIAALILWPFLRNKLSFTRLYLYSLMGYSMSGLLDACTSYGTHLLWPFSEERIAWSIISIFDPVFTFILLLSMIVALRRQSSAVARTGLALAALYMTVGVMQSQRIETAVEALALSRNHPIERLIVKPTIGNLVLWRSIYESENFYYIDAIRAGFGNSKLYPGTRIKKLDSSEITGIAQVDSTLYNDILRFQDFSDGYTAFHPERQDIIGDVRYAMLPTSASPLWGIEFDANKPQQHARYQFYRNMTTTDKELFMSMLLGK